MAVWLVLMPESACRRTGQLNRRTGQLNRFYPDHPVPRLLNLISMLKETVSQETPKLKA